MPIGLISGYHTYGQTKDYWKILQVSLFVGLLYGLIAFAGGITGFAIAPAIDIDAVDLWAQTIPAFGLFLGLFLIGIIETHIGAFAYWFADKAVAFKLE